MSFNGGINRANSLESMLLADLPFTLFVQQRASYGKFNPVNRMRMSVDELDYKIDIFYDSKTDSIVATSRYL